MTMPGFQKQHFIMCMQNLRFGIIMEYFILFKRVKMNKDLEATYFLLSNLKWLI